MPIPTLINQEALDVLNDHHDQDFLGCTLKEVQFVEAYRRTLSLSKAARDAGYDPHKAGRLMARPQIQAALERRRARLLKFLPVSPHEYLQEQMAIGFANLGDYVEWDEDGKVKVRSQKGLTRQELSAIKKIKTQEKTILYKDGLSETTITTEFELHDKQSALKEIRDCLQLFGPHSPLRPQLGHDAEQESGRPDFEKWPEKALEAVISAIKDTQPIINLPPQKTNGHHPPIPE